MAAILAVSTGMLAAVGCGKKEHVSLFPLVSKEDLTIGKTIYKNNCQVCHGQAETGNPPRFPAMTGMPVTHGDTVIFAEAILFNKYHLTRPGGPYLFEEMDDAEIARVANYVRNIAGMQDVPLRAKTVQRAREIHAEKQSASGDQSATPSAEEEP